MTGNLAKDQMQFMPRKRIASVSELLSMEQLRIPDYQRPYKWTTSNVSQLLGDVMTFRHKPSYRLGTVVLHDDGEYLNIVDGQQRTISLLLTLKALDATYPKTISSLKLDRPLRHLSRTMIFASNISQSNIRNNYLEIIRTVKRPDFDKQLIEFLFNRCEVVIFELKDVAEAFQFFDSQNARGRDLEPHDLLKAYHLREFEDDEQIKADTVARWENTDGEKLASFFGTYLYRMRNWTKGRSARYFEKEDTHLFKGININADARFPYGKAMRIVHHFIDNYNRSLERRVDGIRMDFPFSVDQTILNGRRFFEMVSHYQRLVELLVNPDFDLRKIAPDIQDGSAALKIFVTLRNYPGRDRQGDRYVRTIFDCLLVCYIDKFGANSIERAVEKIFVWAYSLRLQMEAVQVASMDNHVTGNNLFRILSDAVAPGDFIAGSLPIINENRATKCEMIYELFKEMRYAQ